MFRKIAGPMMVRSSTTSGTPKEYRLEPQEVGLAGGRFAWFVRVLERSASVVEIGIEVEHGPDGTISTPLSGTAPLTPSTVSSVPAVLFGEADTSAIMGPFVHVIVECDTTSGNSEEWAMIEVYQEVNRFSA